MMRRPLLLVFVLSLLLGGCQSVYYRTMEAFGKHKRDLLVDNVKETRDAQEAAKEQFADALEQFSALVGYDGGDLEAMYKKLDASYKDSEARAESVSKNIDDVEQVAEALFTEWEAELDEYSDPNLRRQSERQLRETRDRFEELRTAMRRAERRMAPVLSAFKDQVLFLKHNLNARAIASLDGTLASLETDIDRLVAEMNASIQEANAFIDAME